MEEALRKAFTHIDDMSKEEAEEYFKRANCIVAEKSEPLPKNAIMILDEGIRRIYGEPPEHTLVRNEGSPMVPEFVIQCKVRQYKTEGKGKTKKMAKQVAYAEMIKVILKNNIKYTADFGIPCSTYEEAVAYIDKINEKVVEPSPVPEDVESDFNRAENYVGMVQELSKKHGLTSNIEYTDRSEGTPADMKFFVTCKVGQQETEGESRKKKDAKAIAAFKMYKILKSGMQDFKNEDFDDLVLGFNTDEKAEKQSVKTRPSTVNPDKSMEEILQDTTKFSSFDISCKELNKLCSFGMTQCMLTLKFVRVGDTAENIHVFPGAGENFDEARMRASLNALLLLETF